MSPESDDAAIPTRELGLMFDMAVAARDALDFTIDLTAETFLASRLHQNAVIRSIEVIGEAAGRISPATQALWPKVAWRDIIGMRHRLIHGYADVDLDLVWQVTRDHLPPLLAALEPALKNQQSRQ